MDENKLRFGVGVLVVSAIGVGILLTFLFGAFPSVLRRAARLDIVFPSAAGIQKDSPVVRDGVKIGRVEDIRLLEEGGVLVSLSIDRDQKLTHRYIPRISSGNLVTGDSELQFVRATPRQIDTIYAGKRELLDQPYGDGDFVDYGSNSESLLALQGDLSQTLESIRAAGDSIAMAGQNVNRLAVDVKEAVDGTDNRLDDVADQAVQTLEEFQAAIRDVRRIVGDPELKRNIDASVQQFPDLLREAGRALESTQNTFESFDRVGQRFDKVGERFDRVGEEAELAIADVRVAVTDAKETVGSIRRGADRTVANAERTFANLADFTEPLADNGDRLVGEVLGTLTRLQGTLAELESFGRSLNNSDGTVKRLLEDDDLYYEIRRSVENIELATARIRPILDDVRVFTDKVARDPRQLGVRGALTKRPNSAGLK